MEVVGQIICGEYGEILIRQKSGEAIELGDLLVVESDKTAYTILQAYNLTYSSQLNQNSLEMISGIHLEGFATGEFMEKELRSYVLASVKALVQVRKTDDGSRVTVPKVLPAFFSTVRKIEDADLVFLEKPEKPLFLGTVRSGSKISTIPVSINGEEAFTHHILIPATTGRGKSNLVKVMLWSIIPEDYCGVIVLDAHDEYYGRNKEGMKDHPSASEKVIYYSSAPPPGAVTLRVNITLVKPWHFRGIADFTEAQEQAMHVFYNLYNREWIRELLAFYPEKEEVDRFHGVMLSTIFVLQRKLGLLLSIQPGDADAVMKERSIFTTKEHAGETTIQDIMNDLEKGKKAIIDTSNLSSAAELLIGSILTHEIFDRYKKYKSAGELEKKPVISIILEEAPRVLATKDSDNIFKTIAREGRKFKIGLTAITQLSSIIPKEILANLNTKIILGNEMAQEREAIIGSASQDLSTDTKMIAALDKGEAIVSSIFTKFAIPVQVPLFEKFIEKDVEKKKSKQSKIGLVG